MEEHPISENLWWVIPGKLAGVRKPAAAEIDELKAAGIHAIVSIMDDPANLDLYQQSDIPYLWLPIKGGTAPDREQVQQLQDFVDRHQGVAVHCTSGRRRTGTMLAAYLIGTGLSADEALKLVLKANRMLNCAKLRSIF
jgi:atypical dual specificity phosphatase